MLRHQRLIKGAKVSPEGMIAEAMARKAVIDDHTYRLPGELDPGYNNKLVANRKSSSVLPSQSIDPAFATPGQHRALFPRMTGGTDVQRRRYVTGLPASHAMGSQRAKADMGAPVLATSPEERAGVESVNSGYKYLAVGLLVSAVLIGALVIVEYNR